MDVLWLAGDDLPRYPSRLSVQPLDDLTSRPSERSNDVFAESLAQLERRSEDLIISQHELSLLPELPRGSYGLLVDGRPLGRVEARRFASPEVDERLSANFGGQLQLVGYTFETSTSRLSLVWQAAPRAWADYTVFVHVVDAAGNRLAGNDAQPSVPTSQWARGEVVIDERVVPIPDDVPPGDYGVVVGIYRADTGERLPLLDMTGAPVGEYATLPLSLTTVE